MNKPTLERLNAALAERDPAALCELLYDEAKRQGISAVARRAGMQRPALYAALHKAANPTLGKMLAIMDALGLAMRVEPNRDTARPTDRRD